MFTGRDNQEGLEIDRWERHDDKYVCIGVSTTEDARKAIFYDYYNQLDLGNAVKVSVHGQSPAKGRNLIIDKAIELGCTHILFIDDDMAFDRDLLFNLLRHDVDIVSGLYLMRNYPHKPCLFDRQVDEAGYHHHQWLEDGLTGLIPMAASGFGGCLIKTEIFKRLEKPYIRLGELESDTWNDDIGFFRRANAAGIQSYCDLDIILGHIATVTVFPKFYNGKWYTEYRSGGIASLVVPQAVKDEDMIVKEKVVSYVGNR